MLTNDYYNITYNLPIRQLFKTYKPIPSEQLFLEQLFKNSPIQDSFLCTRQEFAKTLTKTSLCKIKSFYFFK